jgi:hypothetical protein
VVDPISLYSGGGAAGGAPGPEYWGSTDEIVKPMWRYLAEV